MFITCAAEITWFLTFKKSERMLIASRQKLQLLSSPLIISLNSTPIKQVCQHKLLGIVIDDRLEWHAHVDNICKKIIQKSSFAIPAEPFH